MSEFFFDFVVHIIGYPIEEVITS